MTKKNEETNQIGFDGLGIASTIMESIKNSGFTVPTPIQAKAIPVGVAGKDIIGIAQTGTGKTIAFSIPMLQRIGNEGGQGLIILPTRELALQVDEELHKIARKFGLRTTVLIGGASMHRQMQEIRRKPHIIVATPGRLIDHLERRTMSLIDVRVVVLDEADRMFDMGFAPQIKKIMDKVPDNRQTMLFSATMPDPIVNLARKYMTDPERIEVARAGEASELVEQSLFVVNKRDKMKLLIWLLKKQVGTVLVFSRTKYGAKRITTELNKIGIKAAEIHSNKTLSQRRMALDGFKSGRYRILVATDIAARGIDVTGISLVINYDMPEQAEDYVHRIGRTGRAERKGEAISFAEPDQGQIVTAIEMLIQKYLPSRELPAEAGCAEPEQVLQVKKKSSSRRRTGRSRSGGGSARRSTRPNERSGQSGAGARRRR